MDTTLWYHARRRMSHPPREPQTADATAVPAGFRDHRYRVRRIENWVCVGLLYSFFYMTRYNFSALAPTLREVFGWSKADLGIFETLLPLVYGLSVVLNA